VICKPAPAGKPLDGQQRRLEAQAGEKPFPSLAQAGGERPVLSGWNGAWGHPGHAACCGEEMRGAQGCNRADGGD